MKAAAVTTRTGRFGLANITVSEAGAPPFEVDAVVIEQDTSLLMDPDVPVRDPGLSFWRLARAAARQRGGEPGRVLVRRGAGVVRLWAVVHDLEQLPTCRREWIAEALVGVVAEAQRRGVTALTLPALGLATGTVSMPELLDMLAAAMRRAALVRSLRVWIPVAPRLLDDARGALNALEF